MRNFRVRHLFSGMRVGGFGACWGIMRPLVVCESGRCCEIEISPAERNEITPGPLVV